MDEELKVYLDGMRSDILEMKSDMLGMKSDMLEMKSDMLGMKGDMVGMKGDMVGMKSELIAHTDASVSEMIAHTNASLNELREHMDASLDQAKRELRDHTEAVETRLLGEFFKWARTSDLRYRQGHAVVGALDDRVQAAEDRIAELERRKAG